MLWRFAPSPLPIRSTRARRGVAAAVLVAAGAAAATVIAWTSRTQETAVARLAGAPVPRRILPRVSIATAYRTCAIPPAKADTIYTHCETARGDADARRRAAERARDSEPASTAARAQARALIELVWGGAGNGVDSSISILERLAESHPGAGVLTDLSAAHLLRWERHHSVRDVIAAIDAAERAIALDPSGAAPRFDLGIAVQQLGLDRVATSAWRQYAERELDHRWREEGARWASAFHHRTTTTFTADAPSAALREWAAANPQRARELGMDEWLPAWGRALLSGRTDSAAAMLAAVRALAAGVGDAGDRTLARAVAGIDSARRLRAALALARAHATYGAAQGHQLRAVYDSAALEFDALLAMPGTPFVLRLWAMPTRAAASLNASGGKWRDDLAHRALASVDPIAFPAARGRARWVLGTAALRGGRFGEALELYEGARTDFLRAHEAPNVAATTYLVGETQLRLGETTAGFASMREAVAGLQSDAPSVWLHDALYVLSRAAEGEGYPRAARWIASEDVAATAELDPGRVHRELYMLEARLGLARIVPARPESVAVALLGVPRLLERVGSRNLRTIIAHQEAVVRARALAASDPAAAMRLLDPAVAYFRGRSATRLLPALLVRADAGARLRDAHSADADLEEAASLLDADRAAVTGEWHRALLLAAARRIYERLVMQEARAGQGMRALEYLERGRRSFAASVRSAADAGDGLRMPAGSVALTHALVGDTLLTWVVDESNVSMDLRIVAGDTMLASVVLARRALERRDAPAAAPLLESLFETLVRPAAARLTAGTTLVSVEDGMLAGVPVAALRDRTLRHYLVEDHTVISEASVRDGLRLSGTTRAFRGERTLLVSASGAIRATSGPRPLPWARSEITRIAASHDDVWRLDGDDATADRLATALGAAGVVHFAGHAIADPAQPARSFLQLARGTDGRDRLTAAELERLRLGGVRLFVLAACETMTPEPAGSTYRGLADALRQAGVQGVVGSLWRVDDELTSELMVRFHRALADTDDAATALARAQREMIHGGDARLASPAAWAAFQYTGRWSGGARMGTGRRTDTGRDER